MRKCSWRSRRSSRAPWRSPRATSGSHEASSASVGALLAQCLPMCRPSVSVLSLALGQQRLSSSARVTGR
eukprot:10194081-Lingulodinium_polyedra.AAC.1